MKPKLKGWKEGIISEDLCGFNYTHKKGSLVRYKINKTQPDSDGFRLTEYEWHYLDENNFNLIRSVRKIIEGEKYIVEPYLK
jgi:hypothetical protein